MPSQVLTQCFKHSGYYKQEKRYKIEVFDKYNYKQYQYQHSISITPEQKTQFSTMFIKQNLMWEYNAINMNFHETSGRSSFFVHLCFYNLSVLQRQTYLQFHKVQDVWVIFTKGSITVVVPRDQSVRRGSSHNMPSLMIAVTRGERIIRYSNNIRILFE